MSWRAVAQIAAESTDERMWSEHVSTHFSVVHHTARNTQCEPVAGCVVQCDAAVCVRAVGSLLLTALCEKFDTSQLPYSQLIVRTPVKTGSD